MKKIINIFLLGFLIIASTTASALKIGIVNFGELMEKAPQALEISKKLESEFKKRKDEFEKKAKLFTTERDNFARDREILSEQDATKKGRELMRLEQELQLSRKELQDDSMRRSQEEMMNFQKVVEKAKDEINKEEKFDLILLKNTVMHSDDHLDITNRLLKKLTAQHKTKVTTKTGKTTTGKS